LKITIGALGGPRISVVPDICLGMRFALSTRMNSQRCFSMVAAVSIFALQGACSDGSSGSGNEQTEGSVAYPDGVPSALDVPSLGSSDVTLDGEFFRQARAEAAVDAEGETWAMAIAVDNQFDVYFGSPFETEGEAVGGGREWTKEFTFVAEGKGPTDYLYVATASDQGGAQGFIGAFSNVTRGKSVVTGGEAWQVFAAGAHPETNPYYPEPWPKSVLPTQAEVDTAIAFAEEQRLWVEPMMDPSFDNDPSTDPTENTPWSWDPWKHHYDNVPDAAVWIWHDAGKMEDGKIPGFIRGGDQDEFLIFRVAGAAEILVR